MKKILVAVTAVVLILMVWLVIRAVKGDDGLPFSVGDATIRNITKTEKLKVLTMHKDVLAAQHRVTRGLFSDTEEKLYVIYPATLNFGFDLAKCDTSSVTTMGDTLVVTLPPVEILNTGEKSVDEASKHTAIESGQWSPADMAKLRDRAEALMLRTCEYDSCYHKAERVAADMVALMAKKMGFQHVIVNLTNRDSYGLALTNKLYTSVTPYKFCVADGHSYLAFPFIGKGTEPRLYYYEGNMSQQQLLALGDFFTGFFRSHPAEVELLLKGSEILILFRHDKIAANSREAIQITKKASAKDVEEIRTHVGHDIFQDKYKLRISHIDKQKKPFFTY